MNHLLEAHGIDKEERKEWKVFCIKENVPNAYAMAGGRICFTDGILDAFENVDQLAMVMSHEISHVFLRHSLR